MGHRTNYWKRQQRPTYSLPPPVLPPLLINSLSVARSLPVQKVICKGRIPLQKQRGRGRSMSLLCVLGFGIGSTAAGILGIVTELMEEYQDRHKQQQEDLRWLE